MYPNLKVLGVCSICGGDVVVQEIAYLTNPPQYPEPYCSKCGAIREEDALKKVVKQVIKMVPRKMSKQDFIYGDKDEEILKIIKELNENRQIVDGYPDGYVHPPCTQIPFVTVSDNKQPTYIWTSEGVIGPFKVDNNS